MKHILQIFIILSIFSCKEKPSYNPFDDQFDVSVKHLIRDNCDTIPVECGYYNLSKKDGKLKPYYQINRENFYHVVAKGFIYRIDTFKIIGFRDIYTDKTRIDSIINLPLNEQELNAEFERFGYNILSRNKETLQLVNREKKDTIQLELDAFPRYNYIIRGIGYYKSKKTITK